MNRLIIYMVIPVLLSACVQRKPEDKKEIIIEEIEVEPTKNKVTRLTGFARAIRYVKLETNENCYISRISKWEEHKGLIFIFDSFVKQVFVFDSQGRYQYKIGGSGGESRESGKVHAFCIDTDRDVIETWDAGKKQVIRYDLTGNLMDQQHMPELEVLEFEKSPSGDYVFYSEPAINQYTPKNSSRQLFVFGPDLEYKRSYLPVREPADNWIPERTNGYVTRYEDEILVVPFLGSRVYTYTADTVKVKHRLDFNGHNLTDKAVQTYINEHSGKTYTGFLSDYLPGSNHVYEVRSFYESDAFIYFRYTFQDQVQHTIYSKASRQYKSSNRIYFNMEGGLVFNPFEGMVDLRQDTLVGFISATDFLKRAKTKKNLTPELQAVVQNTQTIDNPIIYYFKLRGFE